jgi:hypothetical protein
MIYLTYSEPADQVIALRVMEIAYYYKVTCFVPPSQSRNIDTEDFRELPRRLSECDFFVAILTPRGASAALAWEIERAKRKPNYPVLVNETFDPGELGPRHPCHAIALLIVGQLLLESQSKSGVRT